jgi:hypothetical protein
VLPAVVLPRYNRKVMAAANLYQAEYLGSGTFIITKPKRKKHKLRQSRVKSPQRGARK